MINLPDPQSRAWKQPNVSDLFGTMFVTKNLNFDSQGYLSLSFSPRCVISKKSNGAFEPVAAVTHNPDYFYYTATWNDAWTVGDAPLGAPPTAISGGGAPDTDQYTGVAYFGGLMVVTAATDVDYYDSASNTWTDTDIVLTTGSQHPPVHFLSLNALAIVDTNTIKLYAYPLSASPNLITTLVIPSDFQITQAFYENQNLYIMTRNIIGGKAAMYVWNGQGTAAQQVYQVNSLIIFAGCAHKDAIFALAGNGALLKFNGGGFDVAAGFPIYYTEMALANYTTFSMYKNIMESNDQVLFINFNNFQNQENTITCQPDGIWCYDDNVGLYHRYANTLSVPVWDTIPTADVNTGNDQITVGAAPLTGTEVIYQANGSPITNLIDGTKYFVIKIDATHIRLAYTYALAIGGSFIGLGGAGNDAQVLIFFANYDYGQYYSGKSTDATAIQIPNANRQLGTDLLWGSDVYAGDAFNLTSYGALMTASSGLESRGYFITPKMIPGEVTDNFNLITLKFLPFISDLDKIILKYRTSDDMRDIIDKSGGNWTVNWASANTFTVNAPSREWALAQVGDEVEFLQGAAAGLIAHITAKVGSLITIDESYPLYTAGNVSKAIFRNWRKWKTVAYGDSNANQHFLSSHLGKRGEFLQLKVELRGVSIKITDLIVDNVSRLPIKQR